MAKFPLGKVPVFEGKEGNLFESNAIAYYVAASKESCGLVGLTAMEKAQVVQFMSFTSNEIIPLAMKWLCPLFGYCEFNAKNIQEAREALKKPLSQLNEILATKTYLVGETVTLADIICACDLFLLMKNVMDAEYRAPFTNVVRWFETVVNQANFKAVAGTFSLCAKAMTEPVPKKETKAAAAASNEEDSELAVEERKPMSALELLPKSSFNLEEWKRVYSDNETRPVATDYFWKNYYPAGFSIWKLYYKFNEELKKKFMVCNLIGGMYQRMEALHKYAFGSMLIFGQENAWQVRGVFVFRGTEIPEEMKDVADFESYDFVKLDDKDPKVREMFNDYIAWDGQLEGLEFAEGKVFK